MTFPCPILRERDQVLCTVSIKLWLNLYIRVNLAFYLVSSKVPHPRSFIISVTLAHRLSFCKQKRVALRLTLSSEGCGSARCACILQIRELCKQFALLSWDSTQDCVVSYTHGFISFSSYQRNMVRPPKLIIRGDSKI